MREKWESKKDNSSQFCVRDLERWNDFQMAGGFVAMVFWRGGMHEETALVGVRQSVRAKEARMLLFAFCIAMGKIIQHDSTVVARIILNSVYLVKRHLYELI